MSLELAKDMRKYEDFRTEILQFLNRDLFGPYTGENEILDLSYDESPLNRYITGVLYPQQSELDFENDDGGLGQDTNSYLDDTEIGLSLSMSNYMYPSCFGFSFTIKKDVNEILCNVSMAEYIYIDNTNKDRRNFDEINEDKVLLNGNNEEPNKKQKFLWQRKPYSWKILIDVSKKFPPYDLIPNILTLQLQIRNIKNGKTATISIVNKNKSFKKETNKEKSKKSFFQVHLSIEGIDEQRPFVERKQYIHTKLDEDIKSNLLLYKSIQAYAIGHGCSVNWEDENNKAVRKIETSFIPFHNISSFSAPTHNFPTFSIKEIAESNNEKLKQEFMILVNNYEDWIKEQESQLPLIEEKLKDIARKHIDRCKEASQRIKQGINFLYEDETVFRAFQLAHYTMLYQLAHSQLQKAGFPPDKNPKYDYSHKWRPFQIAFILQCLESIANPNSKDRDIADLLWFPTGGGKTEAYLGLVAFVLFLRRLRALEEDKDGGGTAVITRYTLRLLTIDQFCRSALLACACEKVRHDFAEKYNLKNTAPISVGLWIGGDSSPNRIDDAKKALNRYKKSNSLDNNEQQYYDYDFLKGDPLKLNECPWCGQKLDWRDYHITSNPERMIIKCPNINCFFNEFLPVWIVDTDIYNQRPSFIISTIDKFARLPWVKESGNLFSTDKKYLPPELIIQDELHLISGPLGTLVGLYEIAIDLLCRDHNNNKPKIIASTATIKNATNQITNLFGKKTRQFPQPALDYRHSFFAEEDKSKPSRIYAGVFIPGISSATSLMRTFAGLFHSVELINAENEIKNPYRTVVGYFNSLRELGAAKQHVKDYVGDYLKFCAGRDGIERRSVENDREITSRINSKEIGSIRTLLWKDYPDEECLDIVLASNMISVGLDIPRLGLMAVVGQPCSTTEYIQATSRVGRKFPGLVITIYACNKSRDRSHYERFKLYHSKLYSHVEPTSVTPLANRARERCLHAILITLIRHLIEGMSDNESAKNFKYKKSKISILRDKILERVALLDSSECQNIKQELDRILNQWENLADSTDLFYNQKDKLHLMKTFEEIDNDDINAFPTLNSLRNVDRTVGLYIEKGFYYDTSR